MGRVGDQRHAAAAGEVADVEGIVVDEQDAARDGRIVAVEPFPSEDAFEVAVLAVVVAAGDDSATVGLQTRRSATVRCRRPYPYSMGLERGWQ